MINAFGKNYYIDLDAVINKCRIEKKEPQKLTKKSSKKQTLGDDFLLEEDDEQQINIFKYEMLKMCIQRIFDEFENPENDMGVFGSKTSAISFTTAFNTLIKYNILIENDDE